MNIPDNLKVLVLGSGGREHALCWKLSQSAQIKEIFCGPGNGGTASVAKTSNVDLSLSDFPQIAAFCKEKKVDLVVVGPDNPIADGVVDFLQAQEIRTFGPVKRAARLESSKVFAKEFMVEHKIPTARYVVCDRYEDAVDLVVEHPWARVIKADGLALGKGVFVCDTTDQCLAALRSIFKEKRFGAAGKQVVIEEKLVGEELSLLAFCDGKHLALMPPSQDHKRRFDADRGPNTGGMGAYSPVDLYNRSKTEIETQVLAPIRKALQSRKLVYKGVLYIGLLIEKKANEHNKKGYQPFVLEFNARFGDPETEALLPLLKSDLLPIFWACTEGKLSSVDVEWSKQASCCVVAAAQNYPESSSKGELIEIKNLPADSVCFHAGTKLQNGKLVTNGGRVLAVTGLGATIDQAADKAYEALTAVSFNGMAFRKDIARRAATRCLSR